MAVSKPAVQHEPAALESAVQRYLADFPALRTAVERERRKYAKHLVPIGQLRAELDQALGDRRLTEVLDETRGR